MKMDDTGWSYGHVDARTVVTADHLRQRHEEWKRQQAAEEAYAELTALATA